MASTEEIQGEILEPMRALFRVPFGIEDPERGLTEYARVLRRHDVATLREGWERIINQHKRRDWPSIYEFIEVFDGIAKERKRIADATEQANRIPDPHEEFCTKVLAFVKRNRATFEAFRDAGVRAVHNEFALSFDSAAKAKEMEEIYGEEIEAAVGKHVPFEGPLKGAWVRPRWNKDKAYAA